MRFLFCNGGIDGNNYGYTAQQAVYQSPAETPVSNADTWKTGIGTRIIRDITSDAADPKYNRNTFKAFLQSPAGYPSLTDEQITNVLDRFFPAAADASAGSLTGSQSVSGGIRGQGENLEKISVTGAYISESEGYDQVIFTDEHAKMLGFNNTDQLANMLGLRNTQELLGLLNRVAGGDKKKVVNIVNNFIKMMDDPYLKDLLLNTAIALRGNCLELLIEQLAKKDYHLDPDAGKKIKNYIISAGDVAEAVVNQKIDSLDTNSPAYRAAQTYIDNCENDNRNPTYVYISRNDDLLRAKNVPPGQRREFANKWIDAVQPGNYVDGDLQRETMNLLGEDRVIAGFDAIGQEADIRLQDAVDEKDPAKKERLRQEAELLKNGLGKSRDEAITENIRNAADRAYNKVDQAIKTVV